MFNSHMQKIISIALLSVTFSTQAAITDLSNAPMSSGNATAVPPNVMFILDDSGSMGWDFMPDINNNPVFPVGTYGYPSSQCNGVYYNPNIIYNPPVDAAGVAYSNSSFTAAWQDGYNTASGTVNLSTSFTFGGGGGGGGGGGTSTAAPAYYYTYSGSQTTEAQKNFYSPSSTFYQECTSSEDGTLHATIAVNGNTNTSIGSITVNGVTITSGASSASTNPNTVASNIAIKITAAGYKATAFNNFVFIRGGTAAVQGFSPVINIASGSMTVSVISKFDNPGKRVFTKVATSATSGPSSTDERTNFANWYSYYHTRILMMKTSAGRAFNPVSSSYRLAFMTINNNVAPDILNFAPFTGTQKTNWYSKLYGATPNQSTPLREALSNAGRIYANKLTSLYGATITDPIQYSCQQNFTILSTDGFWNGNSGLQIDGTTVMGNEDGKPGVQRPQLDGTVNTYTKSTHQELQGQTQVIQATSQTQKRTTQIQSSTQTLQQQISQQQQDVGRLQAQTTQAQVRTSQLQKQVTQLTSQTSTLQGTQSKVLMRCNNNLITCGTAPATGIANANWSVVTSGSCTVATNVQCAVVSGLTGVSNVATSCNTGASITTSTATGRATITVTNSASVRVNSVKIGGLELLPALTSSSSTNNTVASAISNGINNCTGAKTGSCAVSGNSSTVSNNIVTITGPNVTGLPVVTNNSGSATYTYSYTPGAVTYTLNNADSNGKIYSSCAYSAWSTGTNVSSCTAVTQSATPNTTTTVTATQCPTVISSPLADATSCTAGTTGGATTTCSYTPWTAWTGWTGGATACTTIAQSPGSNYTVGTARQCQSTVTAAFANATSCTPTTIPDGSGNTTQCQYLWNNAQPAQTCGTPTYVANNYSSSTVYRNCQTVITSPFANAASCNATTTLDASGNTTQCRYNTSAWANASACTPTLTSPGPNYTIASATQCRTTDTGWVNVAPTTCVPSSSNGQDVTCQIISTPPTPVATCTSTAATAANSWTASTCTTSIITSPTPVPPSTCVATTPSAANGYITTTCTANDVNLGSTSNCAASPASSSNAWTATLCTWLSSSGGSADTLADAAQYYYVKDLRNSSLGNCTSGATGYTTNDVCPDNVPSGAVDTAEWQHMTTFTLGLGARGKMVFSPTYRLDSSGDFDSINRALLADSAHVPPICSWQTNGTTCNWPTPGSGLPENIDDLWHAAVNGRGDYFSATNPTTLADSLISILQGINARTGTTAAAATSNSKISQNDNYAFYSTYSTVDWTGTFQRSQINVSTGAISTAIDWDAQTLLDTQIASSPTAYTTRKVYMYNSAAANKLKNFDWSVMTAAERNNFSATAIAGLTQYCTSGTICLSAADKALAADANLVNFLRGDTSNEGGMTDITAYYRARKHILGDIVSSEPAYVTKPSLAYTDKGYSLFKSNQSARPSMTFVGGNDGMLHAFNATTGAEEWAYVPSFVLPNMYKLADKNYANLHEYFVDGSPISTDVCVSNCNVDASAVWKTILIGGLNKGGRGYYALDVTDPLNPKGLWEFTHANMGYSYGAPRYGKLADGTWVVLLSSGYNNNTTGDGKGHLFVLNAGTGQLVTSVNAGGTIPGVLDTSAGDTTTPSGLAPIEVYAASNDNYTIEAVYGGDILGNLWRFDVNNNVGAAGYDAQLLATLRGPSGNIQSITGIPELTTANGMRLIFTVTGRYLGLADLTDTSVQTIYGIHDELKTTTTPNTAIYNNPRSTGQFVQQLYTASTGDVPTTSNAVDWTSKKGWYVDLPFLGERVNTTPKIALGTLAIASNIPASGGACAVGGCSMSYNIDYLTGAAPVGAANGAVGRHLGSCASLSSSSGAALVATADSSGGGGSSSIATSPILTQLPDGKIIMLIRMSNGATQTMQLNIGTGSLAARRVSWRELISE